MCSSFAPSGEMLVIPRYGGMDGDSGEASLRLFASDVLPEVQSW